MSMTFKKENRILWLVSLPMILYFVWKALIPSWQMVYYDFPNYHLSAVLWSEGHEVSQFYDNDWFEQQGYERGIETPSRFTPFPPISALLMTPLSGLDLLTAKRVWTLINLVMLLTTLYLINRYLKLSLPLSVVCLFILGNALGTNFLLGQFYMVILLGLFIVYLLYEKGYFKWAGSLLAIIAAVKYLPLVFISGFVKKQTLLAFGLVLIALIALQWSLFGSEAMYNYGEILASHLQGDIPGQTAYPLAFQSYDSFFANLFTFHDLHNPYPVLDWTAGKTLGKLLVSVLVLVASYLVWKRYPMTIPALKKDITLIIVGMAVMTLLPASSSYHFILLVFPVTLLFKTIWQHTNWKLKTFLVLLLGITANSSFNIIPFQSGFRLPDLILSYPRLWAMTLLFSVTLFLLHKFRAQVIGQFEE